MNLTQEEKEIARKIQKIFKQSVCGFDLLRSKGKSYVCDVNGFSLVKSSKKYYMDCANQILQLINARFPERMLEPRDSIGSNSELQLAKESSSNFELGNRKAKYRPE